MRNDNFSPFQKQSFFAPIFLFSSPSFYREDTQIAAKTKRASDRERVGRLCSDLICLLFGIPQRVGVGYSHFRTWKIVGSWGIFARVFRNRYS